MSRLILGTVQFGLPYGISNSAGQVSESEVFKILDQAREYGIEILDTAAAYGQSIELIGKYHKSRSHRFKILSKFHLKGHSPSDLSALLQKQLETLDIEQMECLSFHSVDEYLSFKEWHVITHLKDKKLLKNFGVSTYQNPESIQALQDLKVDIVQFPFNILDHAKQRQALLDQQAVAKKTLHTRSAYLQGLFFMTEEQIRAKNRKLLALWPALSEVHQICKTHRISISELALRYCLSNPQISHVLIGVESLKQLQENVADAKKGPLDSQLLAQIESLVTPDSRLLNPATWSEV